MAELSWNQVCEKALSYNKKIISEIDKNKHGQRMFRYECLICGSINEKFYGSVFCNRCKNCNQIKRLNQSILKAKLTCEKYGFIYLDNVGLKGDHNYFLVKCNNCGEEKETQLIHINSCKTCFNTKRSLSIEDFIYKSRLVHGDRFDYSGVKFKNTKEKVKIKCNTCGYVFLQEVSCHYNAGIGCPKCKESKGEKKIHDFLETLNINFERQKKYEGCKHRRKLPFDFYLYDFSLLIEFDGEGHFGPMRFSKDKNINYKKYLDVIARDKIKNDWAKANNIPLLRIPYWDYDRIEELIEAFILQHTKKEIRQLSLEI